MSDKYQWWFPIQGENSKSIHFWVKRTWYQCCNITCLWRKHDAYMYSYIKWKKVHLLCLGQLLLYDCSYSFIDWQQYLHIIHETNTIFLHLSAITMHTPLLSMRGIISVQFYKDLDLDLLTCILIIKAKLNGLFYKCMSITTELYHHQVKADSLVPCINCSFQSVTVKLSSFN